MLKHRDENNHKFMLSKLCLSGTLEKPIIIVKVEFLTISEVPEQINPLVNYLKYTNEPVNEISNDEVCATSKASDQPGH